MTDGAARAGRINSGVQRKNELKFTTPEYRVLESDGEVVLTVVRVDPTGTVSIGYTTEDETAFAGEDYKLTKGTLTFKPGETKKKISVPVFNDAECEPDESFLVTLLPKTLKCKKTECGVGINAQARVFILDHDESKQGEPHAVT